MPNVADASRPEQLLVSVKRAAEMLDLKDDVIYQMCSRGDLDSVVITRTRKDGTLSAGRNRRVVVASIKAWIARQPQDRLA